MNKERINEFRDGIFALRTRRFGTVTKIMIKRLYDLDENFMSYSIIKIKTNFLHS